MRFANLKTTDVEKVAPSLPAVTTADAKLYMAVETTDYDAVIDDIVLACVERVQAITGRQLVTATRTLTLDDFPSDEIRVPRPPLATVVHVKYYDTDGNQVTWDASNYVVDTNATPGRIYLAPGSTWPSTQSERRMRVEVEYTCGVAVASVDPWLVLQLKRLVNQYYKFRGDDGKPVGRFASEAITEIEDLLQERSVYGL